MNKIGILGSGGQADEAESFLSGREVAFRAVSKDYVTEDKIDINNPLEKHINTEVIAAVGAPAVRRFLVEQWPGETYASVVSEHAVVDPSAKVGEGTIIAPRAVITTNVEIGDHCIVNVAATISHNSKLGDFVTVGPGANIAGNVQLGDGVFVGIGATVSNGVEIASGVVIGAGAVVTKSINEENSVYVGVPAKILRKNEDWLNEV